tara:strand:- start:108 stop:596 length:489 start_codon:yes stop_codon:yes gene_type:complete
LDSRKYQLQKQILEALKADNKELYSLLKSQWAHRFGVESLEELKSLDLSQLNQDTNNEDNQQFDQSRDYIFEDNREIAIEDNHNQEKEITNQNLAVTDSVTVENEESFESKSYEIVNKEKNTNKDISVVIDYKRAPEVKALIPLPPKPKYSYLKKWLVRSKF